MKTLRADSTPVEFYNEGLVVFLYDEDNAEAIRDAGPTLLEGFGESEVRDPALARVARDGLLVAIELEQDDEVAIELAIGSPLTEDETGEGWVPAGRALLALPSGSLRVEGYNNLRLSPDYDPDEPGAAVDLPPGRYAVSLYRLPPERDDQFDEPDRSGGDAAPHHIVVLTPARDAELVEEPEPMLLGPRPTRELEDWAGRYELRDGIFHGLAILHPDRRRMRVNVDDAAVDGLGMGPGTTFEVRVPDAGVGVRAVLITGPTVAALIDPMDAESPPIQWVAQRLRDAERGPEWSTLSVYTMDTSLELDDEVVDRWIPATVAPGRSILPGPV